MISKRLLKSLKILTRHWAQLKYFTSSATIGTPFNKQTGYNGHSKRDTKSMTGNRLVLILKVVES